MAPSWDAPARAVGPDVSLASSDAGRRPIEPWEEPYLAALGDALRRMRIAAGLTQSTLATVVGLSERSVRRLERGARRTRRSTLTRLGYAVARHLGLPVAADPIVLALVLTAGPALAPESAHAARLDARRERRVRRAARRPVTEHHVRREPQLDGTVVEHHRHRRWTSNSSIRQTTYVLIRRTDGGVDARP